MVWMQVLPRPNTCQRGLKLIWKATYNVVKIPADTSKTLKTVDFAIIQNAHITKG